MNRFVNRIVNRTILITMESIQKETCEMIEEKNTFPIEWMYKVIQSLRIYTRGNTMKNEERSNVQGRKNIQGIQYKHGRNYERKVHWNSTLPFKVEHIGIKLVTYVLNPIRWVDLGSLEKQSDAGGNAEF